MSASDKTSKPGNSTKINGEKWTLENFSRWYYFRLVECWDWNDFEWKNARAAEEKRTPHNPNYYLLINDFKASIASWKQFSCFYQTATTMIKRAVVTWSWHLVLTFSTEQRETKVRRTLIFVLERNYLWFRGECWFRLIKLRMYLKDVWEAMIINGN